MGCSDMLEYLRIFKARIKKAPDSLTFFVTGVCNSRCRMCFYWQNIDKAKRAEELTLGEIKKIAESMPDFFWLWLSGGEPFLRDDLPQLCQAFYANNHVRNIQIPTNGLLPGKIAEQTRQILECCPKANILVILSIDDIEERHDYIRGVKGNWKKVIETAEKIRELQKQYPRLKLQATVTLSSYNQDHIVEVFNWIEKAVGITGINVNLVRGEPEDKDSCKVDLENYREIIGHLKTKTGKYRQYPFPISAIAYAKDTLQRELILRIAQTNRCLVKCLALRSSIVMDEKGNLYPCEILPDKVGNLRDVDYDFQKLWKSAQAEKLRKYIADGCFCTHECSLSTSVLFAPRYLPRLLLHFIRYATRRSARQK